MKRKKKKNIYKFLTAGFLLVFLFSFITPAVAFDLDFGDMNNIGGTVNVDDVLSDLGIDSTEFRTNMDTLNVSNYKKIPPQVSIAFTPSNPADGEKVTATATPSYFMNDVKNLYFTWYLKTAGCDETANPDAGERDKCDLNNDGEIDIKDYKIKAMRIVANGGFDWENESYSRDSDSDDYEATIGGDDQRNKNEYCYVRDIEEGTDTQITCGHLFPNAPGEDTGDGSFGRDEEEFWRTDPTSDDTAGLGNKDEANVAGLGVNSFTWTFQHKDRVGVVVEGISMDPVSEDEDGNAIKNSSYKTMWAFSKNSCDVSGKNRVSDLNDCLVDNLVDPAEDNGAKRLTVDISYSPQSPVNNPNKESNSGDYFIATASVLNAGDSNYLNYTWQVYESDESNPDSWGSPLIKSELPESTQMSGLGLSNFKFKLNLSDPKKYLKIKVSVLENSSDSQRKGNTDVVVPISSSDDQIKIYNVSVSDSLRLSLGTNERCLEGMNSVICPVVKNEIIGLSISGNNFTDFLWTINGDVFSYQECFFEGCNVGKQTNVAYFPILKDAGEEYTVSLSAVKKNGEKVELSRVFKVVEPEVKISSGDETVCKPNLLGHYVDLDGKQWPDFSKNNFQGLAGREIKLRASAENFFATPENFKWYVDGNLIDSSSAEVFGYGLDSDNGTITLAPKELGEDYDVISELFYTQSSLVKKALNKYWNVNYNQFYEKPVSTGINIRIVNSDLSGSQSSSSGKKIMANLYSSLPGYLTFLIRIVLTAAFILFSSSFLLSFFPNIKNEQ
jgi:hypothetical protein